MAFNLSAQLSVALNTASLKNAANTINNQLKDVGTLRLGIPSGVGSSLREISSQIAEASNAMEQFGRQSGLAAKRFAAFTITAGAIIQFTSSVKQAISSAIEFDREIIRLTQVSNDSAADVGKIGSEVSRLATSYGVSSKELINTAVTLKQANLTLKETKDALEALAQSALAPSFDNLKDTTEGAIAIMNQFNISSRELGGALGAVNSVAAEFAVEAQDLIEGVRKAGGAFRSAGGDLNEFLALFTSVRQTTRESAESIGTGLRTIFTRIQRNDTVEALKEIGVQLRFTAEEARSAGDLGLTNQFVGPYEAIKRLSVALNELRSTDPRFSAIVEELGGYRQISKVIPLVQEFAVSQKALGTAQAGSASLATNAAQAQEAFGVKIQKVAEQFNSFVRDLTNTSSFRTIVDLMLQGASAAIQLADSLKGILPIITAIAAVKFTQGITSFAKGFASTAFNTVQSNQPSTLSMSPFLPNIKKKADGGFIKMAKGGFVPGSGTGDKIPALLEPGEYVIPRKFAAGALVKAFQVAKNANVVQQKLLDPRNAVTEKDYQSGKFINPNDNFAFLTKFFPIDDPVSAKESSSNKKGDMFEAFAANVLNAKRTKASFDVDLIGAGGFPYEVKNEAELSNDQIIASKLARFKSRFNKNAFTNRIDEDTIDLGVIGLVANTANLKGGKDAAEKIAKERNFKLGNVEKEAAKNNRRSIPKRFVSVLAKASGGLVPGVGNTDSVPLDLPVGSYVLRKSSVNSIGASNLARLGRAKGGVIPSLVMPGEYIYTPDEVQNIGVSNLDYMNKTGRRRFAGGGYSDDERKAYRTKKTERDFARQIELQLRIPTSDAGREQNRIEAQSIAEDITKTSKRIKELENNVKKYSNEIGSGLRNEQNLNSVKTRILSDIEQRERIVQQTKQKEAEELRILQSYNNKIRKKESEARGYKTLAAGARAANDEELALKYEKKQRTLEGQAARYKTLQSNKQAAYDAAIDTRILAEQNLAKSNNELDKTNKKLKSNRDKLDLLEKAKGGAEKERADLITKYSSDKEGRILKDGKVITSQYMSGNKTEYQKMLNREMASYRKTFGEKPVGDVRKAIEVGFAEKLQRSYFNQLQSYSKAKGLDFDENLANAQAIQMVREAESGRRKIEKTKSGEFFDPTLGRRLQKEGYNETGSKRGIIKYLSDFSKDNKQNLTLAGVTLLGIAAEANAPTEAEIRSGSAAAKGSAVAYGGFSGLATGAALGSFLPGVGTALGAIAGGAIGAVTALKNFNKQVAEINLEDSTDKLKKELEMAASSIGKVNADAFANIKRLQGEVESQIKAKAESSVSLFSGVKAFFGYGSSRSQEINESILKDTRAQYASQAPQLNNLISREIEAAVKSGNFNIGEFLNQKDISEQVGKIALGLQQPIDKIKKQFEKYSIEVAKQEQLAKRQQEGLKAQEQLIISFSALSSVTGEASKSLLNLNSKFQTVTELLSNTSSISPIRNRSVDIQTASVNPERFFSTVAETAGGLGQFGQQFQLSGSIIGAISSTLPNILSQVNPLETAGGKDPASIVKNALRENLKQRGISEVESSRYVNTIIAKMGDDFSKLLNESGGDYGELAQRLISSIADPFVKALNNINQDLENAANTYINGLNKLAQSTISLASEFEKLSRIQSQNRAFRKGVDIENEIQRQKNEKPLDFRFGRIKPNQIALDMTNIDEQTQAFREQQSRLTGLVGGQELDPKRVQDLIRRNRERQEIQNERLNRARLAGQQGGQEYIAAADELMRLKVEASFLSAAMRNLADSTEELTAIDERISQIRKEIADEESDNIRRQSETEALGERLLTSSPEQLQRYQAGAQLSGLAERLGGNLLRFNVEQRKAIFEYLDMSGDQGKMLKSQFLQASGFVAKPETTAQEKYTQELNTLIARREAVGERREKAQLLIVNEQMTLQQEFFTQLKAQNDEFFRRLEQNFSNLQKGQLEEQQRKTDARIQELQAGAGSVGIFSKIDQNTFTKSILPQQRNITSYLAASEKYKEIGATQQRITPEYAQKIREMSNDQNGFINIGRLASLLQSIPGLENVDKLALEINSAIESASGGKQLDANKANTIFQQAIVGQLQFQLKKQADVVSETGSKIGIQGGAAKKGTVGEIVLGLQNANVTSAIFTKAIEDVQRLGGLVGQNFVNQIQTLQAQSALTAQSIANLNGQIANMRGNQPQQQNQIGVRPRGFSSGGMVTSSSAMPNADPRVFRPQGPDTIPAILQPGEYVVNAKATAENLPLLQTLNKGGQVRYMAEGGNLNDPLPLNALERQKAIEYQKELLIKQAILTKFAILRQSWRNNALRNSLRIQRGDIDLNTIPWQGGINKIFALVAPNVKKPWTKIDEVLTTGLNTDNLSPEKNAFLKRLEIYGMPFAIKNVDSQDILSLTDEYLNPKQDVFGQMRVPVKDQEYYKKRANLQPFFEDLLMAGFPAIPAGFYTEKYGIQNDTKKVRAIGFSKGGQAKGFTNAILNRGEFVVNSDAAANNYGLLEAINNGKTAKFNKGGPVYLQNGGGTPQNRKTDVDAEYLLGILKTVGATGLGVGLVGGAGYFFGPPIINKLKNTYKQSKSLFNKTLSFIKGEKGTKVAETIAKKIGIPQEEIDAIKNDGEKTKSPKPLETKKVTGPIELEDLNILQPKSKDSYSILNNILNKEYPSIQNSSKIRSSLLTAFSTATAQNLGVPLSEEQIRSVINEFVKKPNFSKNKPYSEPYSLQRSLNLQESQSALGILNRKNYNGQNLFANQNLFRKVFQDVSLLLRSSDTSINDLRNAADIQNWLEQQREIARNIQEQERNARRRPNERRNPRDRRNILPPELVGDRPQLGQNIGNAGEIRANLPPEPAKPIAPKPEQKNPPVLPIDPATQPPKPVVSPTDAATQPTAPKPEIKLPEPVKPVETTKPVVSPTDTAATAKPPKTVKLKDFIFENNRFGKYSQEVYNKIQSEIISSGLLQNTQWAEKRAQDIFKFLSSADNTVISDIVKPAIERNNLFKNIKSPLIENFKDKNKFTNNNNIHSKLAAKAGVAANVIPFMVEPLSMYLRGNYSSEEIQSRFIQDAASATAPIALFEAASKVPFLAPYLGLASLPFLPSTFDQISSLGSAIAGKSDPQQISNLINKYSQVFPDIRSLSSSDIADIQAEDSTGLGDIAGIATTTGLGALGGSNLGPVGIIAGAGVGFVIGAYKAIVNKLARNRKSQRISNALSLRENLSSRYQKRGQTFEPDFMKNYSDEKYLKMDAESYFKNYSDELETFAISEDPLNYKIGYDALNKFPYFSAKDAFVYEELIRRNSGLTKAYSEEIQKLEKNGASDSVLETIRQKYLKEETIEGGGLKEIADITRKSNVFDRLFYNNALNTDNLKSKILFDSKNAFDILEIANGYGFSSNIEQMDLDFIKLLKNYSTLSFKSNLSKVRDDSKIESGLLQIQTQLVNDAQQKLGNFKEDRFSLGLVNELANKFNGLKLKKIPENDTSTDFGFLQENDPEDFFTIEQLSNFAKLVGEINSVLLQEKGIDAAQYQDRSQRNSGASATRQFNKNFDQTSLKLNALEQLFYRNYYNDSLFGYSPNYEQGLLQQIGNYEFQKFIIESKETLKDFANNFMSKRFVAGTFFAKELFDNINNPDYLQFLNEKGKTINENDFFSYPRNLKDSDLGNFFSKRSINYQWQGLKEDKNVELLRFNSGGIVPKSAQNPDPSFFKPMGTDTVPAMLSPGEYVVNAESTAANLPLLQQLNNGGPVYARSGGYGFNLMNSSGIGAINFGPEFMGMERSSNPWHQWGGFSTRARYGRRPSVGVNLGPQGARALKNYNPLVERGVLSNMANYFADRGGTKNGSKFANYMFNFVTDKKTLDAFNIAGDFSSFSIGGSSRVPDLFGGLTTASMMMGPAVAGAMKYGMERAIFSDIYSNKEIKSELTGGNKISLKDYINLGAGSTIGSVSASNALSMGTLGDSSLMPGNENINFAQTAIQSLREGLGDISANATDIQMAKNVSNINAAVAAGYQNAPEMLPTYGEAWAQEVANRTAYQRYSKGSSQLYNNPWHQFAGFSSVPNRYLSGGGSVDTIPAMLTPGEYVVNKQAVNRVGTRFLDGINNVRGYANGGFVKYFADGSPGGVSGGGSMPSMNFTQLFSAATLIQSASSVFGQSVTSIIQFASAITSANQSLNQSGSILNSATSAFTNGANTFSNAINSLTTSLNSFSNEMIVNVAPIGLNINFNSTSVVEAVRSAISQIESSVLDNLTAFVQRQIKTDEMG